MITPNETAALLIQALPYIRRFTGKVVVLKVGGLPMTDPATRAAWRRTCCCSTRSASARCSSTAAARKSTNR